jgi:hypothetical protein
MLRGIILAMKGYLVPPFGHSLTALSKSGTINLQIQAAFSKLSTAGVPPNFGGQEAYVLKHSLVESGRAIRKIPDRTLRCLLESHTG